MKTRPPGGEKAVVVTMDTRMQPIKKGILVHPPWVPNFLQNVKGGWKSFISKDVWISQTSSKSAWREEWQQPKDTPVIYNKIFSTGKKYNFQLNFKRNLFVSSNFFISATLD